jgi:hypothetical protein
MGLFSKRSSKVPFFQYVYFDKHKRENAYTCIKNFADYLAVNNISSVVFLDRSARPAWVGLREYWKINYKEIPMPQFYFVNPSGFDNKILATQAFPVIFKRLCANKDQSLVVFDVCCHSGGTIRSVTTVLDFLGFTDVRIITASYPDAGSGITAACKIDTGIIKTCGPFGSKDIIKRSWHNIISDRCSSLRELNEGIRERQEIKHLIRDCGK